VPGGPGGRESREYEVGRWKSFTQVPTSSFSVALSLMNIQIRTYRFENVVSLLVESFRDRRSTNCLAAFAWQNTTCGKRWALNRVFRLSTFKRSPCFISCKLFEGGRIQNCIKRQNLTLTHFCSLFSLSVFIFMNSLFEFPSLANLSHRISTTHLLTQNLSAHTFTATQCAALLTSYSLFCS